jgi:hypothetical protein
MSLAYMYRDSHATAASRILLLHTNLLLFLAPIVCWMYASPSPTPNPTANGTLLESQEKEKKRKHYLEACLERRRHFTPFVCSVDGMLGREAKTFAKRLAAKLANKWEKSYSQVCGHVNARLSIAIVRAAHLCMRGSRVPVHKISIRYPQWEDGAGLSLFEC